MTVKTTYKKAKSSFHAPTIRRRAKKLLRKRYKKTVSLSKIKKVWDDCVEHLIVDPLIEYGSVQLDSRFKIEVVGEKIHYNKRAFNLMSNGLMVKGGAVKKLERLNETRRGYIYSIKAVNDRFKEGVLMFDADKKIKKRLNYALENTNNYYRIEQ